MGKGQGRGPVCLAKSLREEAVLEASLIKEGNCLKVDKVVDTPGQGQKHGCDLDRGVKGSMESTQSKTSMQGEATGWSPSDMVISTHRDALLKSSLL